MTRSSASRASSWAALALAAVVLAGCATAPSVPQAALPSPSAPAATPAPAASCDAATATQSYAPSTTSSYAAEIKARKFLVVGVSADTNLLGSVVPGKPNTFQGFDIDMARAVAKAIFGSDDPAYLRFKVISAGQRIGQLSTPVNAADISKGGVDLVARAFTITCARWQQIAFSVEYLHATQKLLVPVTSTATGPKDLEPGSKVCATSGSTSIEALKAYPNVVPVGVALTTDCLALLQEGQVAAITGDDAILAGLAAQDPGAKVLPQKFGADQPYGLGISLSHKDFAAYVNNVLAGMRADGSWQAAYDRWFKQPLGATGKQPDPVYGRAQ